MSARSGRRPSGPLSPREHGRDLNYDLMKDIPQVRFKQDSKWLEAQTGEELRSRGYVVEGAH